MSLYTALEKHTEAPFSGEMAMTVFYRMMDKITEILKNTLTEEKFRSLEESLHKLANQTGIIAFVFALVSAIIMYQKTESTELLGAGIGTAFGMVLLGYIGEKFLGACETAVQANPLHFSTHAYTDLGGTFFGLLSTLFFLAGVFAFTQDAPVEGALIPIAASIPLLISAWLILNPNLIGLVVDPKTKSSQEAVSLLFFPFKMSLKGVKIISASLLLIGIIAILFGVFKALADETGAAAALLPMGYASVIAGMGFPILSYFSYMLVSTLLDGLRNIFLISSINQAVQTIAASQASRPVGPAPGAVEPGAAAPGLAPGKSQASEVREPPAQSEAPAQSEPPVQSEPPARGVPPEKEEAELDMAAAARHAKALAEAALRASQAASQKPEEPEDDDEDTDPGNG